MELPRQVLTHVLSFLPTWRDVLAVAGSCKHFRNAAEEWTLMSAAVAGVKSEKESWSESERIFEGFEWSDWETLSEASQVSPVGGRVSLACRSPCTPSSGGCLAFDQLSLSPKTPSPQKTLVVAKAKQTIHAHLIPQLAAVGKWLTSIRIQSFSLDDAKMQKILKSCPSLVHLEVCHICAQGIERSTRALLSLDMLSEVASPVKTASTLSAANHCNHTKNTKCMQGSCGCAVFTGAGLQGLEKYCPLLHTVSLTLEHVTHPKEVSDFMTALSKQMGNNLRSLSITIREPVEIRHQSMKRHFEWHQQNFFSHQHLKLLAQETSSKLEHLSLEPWDITSESLQWCAAVFPNLKTLNVSNPVVSQPDGDLTGGIDFKPGEESLAGFRKLQVLRLSPILSFEDFFHAFRECDHLTHSLREMNLNFRCTAEDWELGELQQQCKQIERVSLTYMASTEVGQVECEWQRGREVSRY